MLNAVTRQRAMSFFRSLADGNRLRLVGLLASSEATADELSTALALKPAVVLKQVQQLQSLGVVTARSDGAAERYQIDLECLRLFCRELAEPEPTALVYAGVVTERWERDILRNFFRGERLKEIPVGQKRRQPVLKWLTTRFDLGKRYPEAEVNALLQNHHPDCATLRRYLVDDGYLQRDHGIYWRVATESDNRLI